VSPQPGQEVSEFIVVVAMSDGIEWTAVKIPVFEDEGIALVFQRTVFQREATGPARTRDFIKRLVRG
jgi:hypothetical protein